MDKPTELPSRTTEYLPELIAIEDKSNGYTVKVVNMTPHVVTDYTQACLKAEGIISNPDYDGVIIIPFKK